MDADKQKNGSDCGVHAICNLVSIASGIDPTGVTWAHSNDIRQHLLKCLENGHFTTFPTKRAKRKRLSKSGSLHSMSFKTICTCKMPNDITKFSWQCTSCRRWFHP